MLQDGSHDLMYQPVAAPDGDRQMRRLVWFGFVWGIGNVCFPLFWAIYLWDHFRKPPDFVWDNSPGAYCLGVWQYWFEFAIGPIGFGAFGIAACVALCRKRAFYFVLCIVAAALIVALFVDAALNTVITIGRASDSLPSITMWRSEHSWGTWGTIIRDVAGFLEIAVVPTVLAVASYCATRRRRWIGMETFVAVIAGAEAAWMAVDRSVRADWGMLLESPGLAKHTADVVSGYVSAAHLVLMVIGWSALLVGAIIFVCTRRKIQRPLNLAAMSLVGLTLWELLQDTLMRLLAWAGMAAGQYQISNFSAWIFWVLSAAGTFAVRVGLPALVVVILWRGRGETRAPTGGGQ